MLLVMSAKYAGLAAYQRVAEMIKDEIKSGALKPGEKLPGNRRLAEQYEVALATAQKALGALAEEGWVLITPTVGVFVSGEAGQDQADDSQLAERVERLIAAVESFDRRLTSLESVVYQQQSAARPRPDADLGQ